MVRGAWDGKWQSAHSFLADWELGTKILKHLKNNEESLIQESNTEYSIPRLHQLSVEIYDEAITFIKCTILGAKTTVSTLLRQVVLSVGRVFTCEHFLCRIFLDK